MCAASAVTPETIEQQYLSTVPAPLKLTTPGRPVDTRQRAFAGLMSLALHLLSIAVLLSSAWWTTPLSMRLSPVSTVVDITPTLEAYVLPASPRRTGGGGGGGDRDKLAASKGGLPKSSLQQIVPPMVVVRNQNPALTAEPTVVVPPDIPLPHGTVLGDPLSIMTGPPSNGTGSGGGIGSGSGGGVGSGHGPGAGPGWGGGIGGGAFRVGGGISPPRWIAGNDPEFSEEARKAKYQGTVVLWIIVGPDGRPRDIRVQRSLGMGLDEKAVEAVRMWRFEPAHRDGVPVAVQVNIEVNFRLY